MRKYRGRKDKRAHDHMIKRKIKGQVIYCNMYHYVAHIYDPDEKSWKIVWVAYNC